MKRIKVAAGVLNLTPLAWDRNRDTILAAIQEARGQGVGVLCLPEMCITGYGCEDAYHSASVHQLAAEVLSEIAPHTADLFVCLGLPVYFRGGVFNCVAAVADSQILGLVAKQNLAGEGLHYEPRWFKPWPRGVCASIELADKSVPMGDLIFDLEGVRIGFEICEDAWVPDRTGAELALRGADVLLNPSASHFAFGKHQVRQRFVLDGSRAFNVTYVYTNLVGNEAGRVIYDGGAMIACCGRMVAMGPRFSFTDYQLTAAVVDIDAARVARARVAGFRIQVADLPGSCVRASFHYPSQPPAAPATELPAWERSPRQKEEEFTRAIALGLFDYLRKSRSQGFVVSLSGGADSSAVATLVALMVQLSVAELGMDSVRQKLSYLKDLPADAQPRQLVRRLLTCVYQSTRNSSDTTRNAARSVAESLGARFLELNVDDLVQRYIQIVSQAEGRELTWQRDDLALQNIQARARGPGIWLLANLNSSLLLSTSNRSEAAVGYATMDGDTCGGLSPIAGIDKAFLLRWMRWMETQGPEGLYPIAALAAVTGQAPTAELRPADQHQTDEADLMPYVLLDAIERAAIRDKQSPIEVYLTIQQQFPNFPNQQLVQWIERFFHLWARNQWKRERYAPSFHVDDENLDPKTWCRFPILSGGYERELRQLRQRRTGL